MRCATIGCDNPATQEVSYNYRGVFPTETELCCDECTESYSRRPVLVNFESKPLRMREHEWQRARFTGAVTCANCGLLPLDDDDYNTECEGSE